MVVNVLILGILVGIIFYELTDVSPGGIIVPGLMVMYINQVERMIYTVIISIATYYIVKLLSRYLVIFGRRRLVMMIIVSILLNAFLQLLLNAFTISLLNVSIIGYTISGIIANDIYKQGIKRTIPALTIVVCIIELLVIILNQFGVVV